MKKTILAVIMVMMMAFVFTACESGPTSASNYNDKVKDIVSESLGCGLDDVDFIYEGDGLVDKKDNLSVLIAYTDGGDGFTAVAMYVKDWDKTGDTMCYPASTVSGLVKNSVAYIPLTDIDKGIYIGVCKDGYKVCKNDGEKTEVTKTVTKVDKNDIWTFVSDDENVTATINN